MKILDSTQVLSIRFIDGDIYRVVDARWLREEIKRNPKPIYKQALKKLTGE